MKQIDKSIISLNKDLQCYVSYGMRSSRFFMCSCESHDCVNTTHKHVISTLHTLTTLSLDVSKFCSK